MAGISAELLIFRPVLGSWRLCLGFDRRAHRTDRVFPRSGKTFIVNATTGLVLTLIFVAGSAHAFDISKSLSVDGVLAGALQCQRLTDDPDGMDSGDTTCKGAVPFQPRLSWRPTPRNEVFIKLGFAQGNALNDTTPFVLSPWIADLEDNVKDINGRNRDYILTAWYNHRFSTENIEWGVTFGIIDATDYIDVSQYANDEYTQFMNQALVNGPNAFLQSYDLGASLTIDGSRWSLRGVFMNVGENDDGNNFDYYALQLAYHHESSLGMGNYRLIVSSTSKEFLDPAGEQNESLSVVLVTADQQLGDSLGAWIRLGVQDNNAVITFENIYSGGIDIKGSRWGRPADNIGIGYAALDGGNTDISQADVFETYYRMALGGGFHVTADLQFQDNHYRNSDPVKGWIYSLRATAEF